MTDFSDRYNAVVHRIQTAIGFRFSIEQPWMDDRLLSVIKHLRVGVDTSKADMGGLVTLLINKGVFTREEYFAAILESNDGEAEMQQEALQKVMAKGNPDLKVRTV